MLSKNRLKELLKLKTKKGRKEKKRFLVEGKRFLKEALESNWMAELVLFSEIFERTSDEKSFLNEIKKKGIEIIPVKNQIIKSLSDTVTPQGIIGVVQKKEFISQEAFALKKTLTKEISFILALDSVHDPGNLGTLIRTADAAGVELVLLSEDTAELYNPKVLRSTMGSIFHLPIVEDVNLKNSTPFLKKDGFKIFASEVKAGKLYDQLDYSGKVCLIIGSEAEGIDEKIKELSDEIVRIPIYGKAESLNASVAGGIILFEMARKRRLNK
jgi:TrmH family RNA methyltransferase